MAFIRRRGFNVLQWALMLMRTGSAHAQAGSLTSLVSSLPPCALPCVLDNLQAANCSLVDVSLLSTCICQNTTVLADLSECTQQSCNFTDQILAVETENDLCAAFPKESKSHDIKVAAIVTLALSVPVVLARLATRLHTTHRLWADDCMALLGMMFLAALASMEIASAQMGFGLHYWNVPVDSETTLLQMFYVGQMLYILVQVFAKVAIILLFWRVFLVKWFSIASKIFLCFMFGHGLIFILVVAFQCTPVNSIWDRTITGKCLDMTAIGYAGAALSIAEDISLILLPIPELYKLQVTLHQKLSLAFLFTLASFATVTSMVRLKFLVTFANTYDLTWDNVDIVVWSLIELLCAVFLGSLPTLRPWFIIIPRLVSKSWSRRSRKNYDNNLNSYQGYYADSSRVTNHKGSVPLLKSSGGYYDQNKAHSYPMEPVHVRANHANGSLDS